LSELQDSPETINEPFCNSITELASSKLLPPIFFCHCKFPVASIFKIQTSLFPKLDATSMSELLELPTT